MSEVRKFETGATRSADAGRYDPEGFLSPIVIERFCEYMNKHRLQPDGSVRDSDNWQKGIPPETYMKGLWRHVLHAWTRHRGFQVMDPGAARDLEEDLCAILFNANGLLFELLKNRRRVVPAGILQIPPPRDIGKHPGIEFGAGALGPRQQQGGVVGVPFQERAIPLNEAAKETTLGGYIERKRDLLDEPRA